MHPYLTFVILIMLTSFDPAPSQASSVFEHIPAADSVAFAPADRQDTAAAPNMGSSIPSTKSATSLQTILLSLLLSVVQVFFVVGSAGGKSAATLVFSLSVMLPEASGAMNFQRTYSYPGDDYSYGVAPTPDNAYCVAGYSKPVSSADQSWSIWLMKVAAEGTIVWSMSLGSVVKLTERMPLGLVATADSGCVVAAAQFGSLSKFYPHLFAVHSNGSAAWDVKMDGAVNSAAESVFQLPSGVFLAVGSAGLVGEVSAAGRNLWTNNFCAAASGKLVTAGQLSDGSIVAAGTDIHNGYYACWVVKTPGTGNNVTFSNYYGGSDHCKCSSLAVLPGDYIVFVGCSGFFSTDNDLFLLKTTAEGVVVVNRTVGRYVNSMEIGRAVLYRDATVFVLGRADNGVVLWLVEPVQLNITTNYSYPSSITYDPYTMDWTPDGSLAITGDAGLSTRDCFLLVDSCRPGNYTNSAPPDCHPCMEGCELCNSGTICERCNSTYFLTQSGQCVTKCPNGAYPDSLRSCQNCYVGCTTCESLGMCTGCKVGYYKALTENGTSCVETCPQNYKVNATTQECDINMVECGANCSVCNITGSGTADCLVCNYQSYIIDNYTCEPCPEGCQSCSRYHCELCLPDRPMLGYSCPLACPVGYFSVESTVTAANRTKGHTEYLTYNRNKCVACVAHCAVCEFATRCATCEPGYYLDTFDNGVQQCVATCRLGYCVSSGNVCTKCLSGCQNCTNDFQCNKCGAGYLRKSPYDSPLELCVRDCAPKYFAGNATNCAECDFRCLTCLGPSNRECLACDSSLSGVIVSEVVGPGLTCVCRKGYAANMMLRKCVECTDPLCATCNSKNLAQCYSCFTDRFAMIYDPATLTCICPKDTYKDGNDCPQCNSLCSECTGPESTQCLPGKCGEYAYPLASTPTTCLFMCEGTAAGVRLYIDPLEGTCKPLLCHSECLTCTGTKSSDCVTCKSPIKFQLGGICLGACPTGYFADTQRICLPCGANCDSCVDAGTCSVCAKSYLLQSNKCVNRCATGRYNLTGEALCRSCILPCVACDSDKLCARCAAGYYLYQSACWTGAGKPNGTYISESETFGGRLLPCSEACITCTGPTEKDCLTCRMAEGYTMSSDGTCRVLSCSDGYYLQKYANGSIPECVACAKACLSCTGAAGTDCIGCRTGYIAKRSTSNRTIQCWRCEDTRGLRTEGAHCEEVCGDGVNLGGTECDDGNTAGGDGCSEKCTVEPGFVCRRETAQGKDYCYTTAPPIPILKVHKDDSVFTVSFSRTLVLANNNTERLLKSIKIELLRAGKDCSLFTWLAKPISTPTFSAISFGMSLNCSIAGERESLRVTFKNPALFVDSNEVTMRETEIVARLSKNAWIDPSARLVVSSTGDSFKYANFAVVGLSLLQYMAQSVALGSVWALVNMLQILYYTQLLEMQIPQNLQLFLNNYLSVAKMKLPFSVDLTLIFPASWVSQLESCFLGIQFQSFGLNTASFLYNFYEQLFTWVLLFCCYIGLSVLDRLRPKGRFGFISRWKQEYVYNAVIRVLIETYLDLVFCSLLNIYYLGDASNLALQVSSLAAAMGFTLSFAFLVCCARLSSRPAASYSRPEFQQRYSSLVNEFWLKRGPMVRGCYCVFLVRRLVFIAALLIIQDVIVELLMIMGLDLAYLLYLCWFRPYKSKFDGRLNVFNEFVLLAIHTILLYIKATDIEGSAMATGLGWGCIVLVLMSAGAVWLCMLIPLVTSAVKFIRRYIAKARSRGTHSVSVPMAHRQEGMRKAMTVRHFPCSRPRTTGKWHFQRKRCDMRDVKVHI